MWEDGGRGFFDHNEVLDHFELGASLFTHTIDHPVVRSFPRVVKTWRAVQEAIGDRTPDGYYEDPNDRVHRCARMVTLMCHHDGARPLDDGGFG